jgi:cation:H+ antiporter
LLNQTILIIIGLIILIISANWIIKGAIILAKKHNLSDLTIGLTVVAFGTSAPELFVNTYTSFLKQQEIIFGNVIGSNNFNLFFILGITGIITPFFVKPNTIWKEIPFSLFTTILLYILVNLTFGDDLTELSRIDGIILILIFCLMTYYLLKRPNMETVKNEVLQKNFSTIKTGGIIILGLAGLIIGSELVVRNAVEMASQIGISQKTIGLTVIAAGTSLPELVTSVVAAMKKNAGIAIGNVIGSNIFNVLFILGTSALINPIQYNITFNMELYLLMGGICFLFITMFIGQKQKFERWKAVILLITYLSYVTYLIQLEN